ncbi:hypothetical protein [Limimaricola hongkongensis]|uniref:Flp pilus assembly protein, pilin Flp n=1 Tax=Limimaricola hongkongensis DSM 17492 TaxID=1122180 RepID=A0A017H9I2_9RHOB|nr:hypothetical protein [Limimaricola hongkongensis]EYD71147.1 hypothetical protein Lokhon_02794 [Limimaricola hongkongensis DSM 17492]
MLNFFKKFANDEAGAVTVDWVVLTAAIVGLGVAILAQVTGEAKTLAEGINTNLDTQITNQSTGY